MDIYRPISSIMENFMSEVIELDRDITIDDAVGLFKNNSEVIIAIIRDSGNFSLIDKDIILDILMNDIDKSEYIGKHGTSDYCVKGLNDYVHDIANRFLIVTDNLGKIKGVARRSRLRRLVSEIESSSEFNLDMIFDNINQGILAINLIGEIVSFNDRAEEILKLKRDAVIGRKINDVIESKLESFMHGDDDSQMERILGDTGKTIFAYRYKIRSKGKTIGAISLFEDVSRYENMNRELSEVKALNKELDAIVENSYDGIYVTRKDGKTLRLNTAYERITGIKKDEVLGLHMSEIVEKGILSKSITGDVVRKRIRITDEQVTRTGKRILITGNPLFGDDGEVEKVLFNVRDITELSDLKDALKKNTELTELYKQEMLHNEFEKDYVYKSEEFENCVTLAKRIANTDMSVLILGETGVGKEVMAKIVHSNSYRSNENFIKINCGAIPKNLLESELFGYEPGAFTGADRKGKTGLFELADKGTIFLDEIGELPLDIQVKFLRVLQDQEVSRIGSTKNIKVDVRVIAATNRNLSEMVKTGDFRSDLYYRLNVIPIMIPPLRERKEDITVLAQFFLDKLNVKYNTQKSMNKEFEEKIRAYSWPGNIRELKNVIERSYITSDSQYIGAIEILSRDDYKSDPGIIINGIMPLKTAKDIVERELIIKVMKNVNNTYKAAEILEVSQATVARKSKQYNDELLN